MRTCLTVDHHHHHHHMSVMELGHLLTRSGVTYLEVSSTVCHDSFCQLGNSVLKLTVDQVVKYGFKKVFWDVAPPYWVIGFGRFDTTKWSCIKRSQC
jgi:hypothetical protein